MKPIALQLYTLRELAAEDFPAVLRKVAEIGFVGVEFAGFYGHKPDEIATLLDKLGLRVCGSHVPLPTMENEAQMVQDALVIGCNWMVVSGIEAKHFPTASACRVIAEKLEVAAELLRPHGINLGYHNHWWEFDKVENRVVYDLLLDNSPNMFSELDIYWAATTGADPAKVIANHSSRIPMLHVKDGPAKQDEPQTAVGAGTLNIPEIIKAADPNVLQWLIVELDECATDMLEAVQQSYDYLVSSGLARGKK